MKAVCAHIGDEGRCIEAPAAGSRYCQKHTMSSEDVPVAVKEKIRSNLGLSETTIDVLDDIESPIIPTESASFYADNESLEIISEYFVPQYVDAVALIRRYRSKFAEAHHAEDKTAEKYVIASWYLARWRDQDQQKKLKLSGDDPRIVCSVSPKTVKELMSIIGVGDSVIRGWRNDGTISEYQYKVKQEVYLANLESLHQVAVIKEVKAGNKGVISDVAKLLKKSGDKNVASVSLPEEVYKVALELLDISAVYKMKAYKMGAVARNLTSRVVGANIFKQ